jgi:hypothetical protein
MFFRARDLVVLPRWLTLGLHDDEVADFEVGILENGVGAWCRREWNAGGRLDDLDPQVDASPLLRLGAEHETYFVRDVTLDRALA